MKMQMFTKTEQDMGSRPQPPDIIIIDDDESSSSQAHHAVDRNYSKDRYANSCGLKKHSNQQRCWKSADGFSVGHSEYSGNSYDDDCFVVQRGLIESGPSHVSWHLHKRAPKAEKRPAIMRHDPNYYCSSSDCEIIEDLDGKIRQDWERAALKKRFGNSYNGSSFRAESEESTSAALSGARLAFLLKGKRHFQQSDHKSQRMNLYDADPSCNPSNNGKDSSPVTLLDQQDSNQNFADTRSEDSVGSSAGETSVTHTGSLISANNLGLSEEEASCSDHKTTLIDSNPSGRIQSEDLLYRQEGVPAKHRAMVHAAAELLTENLFFVQKRVRETEEPEWAQCQGELRSQAKEACCEQKKRRVDNESELETEIRQKERLDKIILNQEEDGFNGENKEVYGQVQSEIEGVAASAPEIATLLHNLGTEVDGGICSSIQQVDAAYKGALWFPPRLGCDFNKKRSSASNASRGDLQSHVQSHVEK